MGLIVRNINKSCFGLSLRFFLNSVILIFSISVAFAKKEINVDSIRIAIKHSPEDTSLINFNLEIGKHFLDKSLDSASYYFNQAYASSIKLKAQKHLGYTLLNKGELNIKQGDFGIAKDHFLEALEIFQNLKIKKGIITARYHVGFANYKLLNFNKALEIYFDFDVLKSAEKLGEKEMVAKLFNDIGVIHLIQENFEKALEFYHRSLEIRKEINDKKGLAQAYNNIGLIHARLKNHLKAIQSYLKCYEIGEEINYLVAWSASSQNIGQSYFELGEIKLANKYFDKALKIAHDADLKDIMVGIYENRSTVAKLQGDFLHTIEWGLKGIEVAKHIEVSVYLKNIYNLSSVYNNMIFRFLC